jgi:hypothetical protein
MQRAGIIVLCLLSAASAQTQTAVRTRLHFDLTKIGSVLGGQQICEDRGRLQDYPSKVMDQIIAGGTTSIPVLIEMISDRRRARTTEPIICFWPGMAIGDIAFCTLTDLFTDSTSGKSTLPGAGWDEMLGPAFDRPAWDQLRNFIQRHGRFALQAKWQKLWDQNKNLVYWDPADKCFKARERVSELTVPHH